MVPWCFYRVGVYFFLRGVPSDGVKPLIGGMLERPADKFPAQFGNSSFLQKYPYFLPCFVSAAIAVACWFIVALFFKEVSPLFIKV